MKRKKRQKATLWGKRRIRSWNKTGKEMLTTKHKTRHQTASFFSALALICSVTFALLLLLAVTSLQTSPRTPIVLLLASAAGALSVIAVLLLVLGIPIYNYVSELDDRQQKLEERFKAIELQDQGQHGLLEIRRPPFNAEYVLYLLLRNDERDAFIGDLVEEYGRIRKRFGKRRADIWFYKQVGDSLFPLLRRALLKIGALVWLGRILRRLIS